MLETKLFDDIVVSTDSPDIISTSSAAGATRYIVRPEELADDHTATKPVIQHALGELALSTGDAVCCVYPCNPFLDPETLKVTRDPIIEQGMFLFASDRVPTPSAEGFHTRPALDHNQTGATV